MRTALSTAMLLGTGGLFALDLGMVDIHGFASQGYLATTHNNFMGPTTGGGTFEFNEFALNATARPMDDLQIGVQLLAYDLGDVGNDRLQVDWAYGRYSHAVTDSFSAAVTAGRFKTGWGLYGDVRDVDVARSMVFLPINVYSNSFRDIYIAVNGAGLSLSGSGSFGFLEGMVYLGTNSVDLDGPIGSGYTYRTNAGPNIDDYVNESARMKNLSGFHLNWDTPMDGLRLHAAGLHVSHLTVSGEGTLVPFAMPGIPLDFDLVDYWDGIAGFEYQHGNFTLASEGALNYYRQEIDVGNGLATDTTYTHRKSVYVLAAWRVLPRLELGTCLSLTLTGDGHDDTEDPEHRGVAFSMRYDPMDHWLIKLEFQRNRGTAALNGFDNPDGFDGEWWNMVAVKTTFDF